MRGKIDSPTKGEIEVKDMPERVTNLGLDYRHRPTSVFAGFSVNYIPKFTRSSINDDGVLEEKTTKGRTGLDLYLGRAFSPLAELRLIARNVLSVNKEERTVKRNETTGVVTSDEVKIERSEPTVMLTFESRF
jgi:iron complex outermembrane receptor protein